MVQISVTPTSLQTNWVWTDAHGRFEVPGLSERSHVVRITDGKHVERVFEDVRLPQTAAWTIVLEKGAAMAGTVHWSDGRPASGARIALRRSRALEASK